MDQSDTPSYQGSSDRSRRQEEQESGDRVQQTRVNRPNDQDQEDRLHVTASNSVPIPNQPDSRSRYRKSSGDGRSRKTSDTIPIHPSREGSMSTSRRSYSRGAIFGDIPEYIGTPCTRRPSVGTIGSDLDVNEDLGLGASSIECESEIEAILGGQKSYASRISVTINPVTGEKLFWGFTKKQWFLLLVFSIADLLAGIVYSLQAPFYPEEAEKKGATATQYGLVFGVFELTMFVCAPIYGRYMSALGPRNVFNAGIFITGTCCALFGLLDRISDKWTFIGMSFAVRIVEAVGNAGFSTATFTIIAVEFPNSIATTFASLETFFGLGLIVGPTLGGALYQVGGYTLPFMVTGGLIFTTALLIAIFMPKGQSLAEQNETKEGAAGYGILTILKIPGVLLATLSIITGAFSIGFLSSSLEPHIRQFNLTPLQTGLVFVINGGVYALTAPGWGWLCDRVRQTKYITLAGAIFLTLGFLLIGPAPFFPFETVLWVTCVGLFIQGLGVGATFVSSFILALRHSIASGLPDNIATYSVVSGLWSSVLALGLFAGPSLAGFLYDTVGFRWGSMFVVFSGVLQVFLIAIFILHNGKAEQAYLRIVDAASSRSNSSTTSETEPILGRDDDLVPDIILPGDENSINAAPHPRNSYGSTGTIIANSP